MIDWIKAIQGVDEVYGHIVISNEEIDVYKFMKDWKMVEREKRILEQLEQRLEELKK